MKKIYLLAGFILIVLVQLFLPSKLIYDQEAILSKGKAYKFLTRPIDPNDPFRGKYIVLNYTINQFPTTDASWKRGDPVYVYIKDSLGFAKLDTVSKTKLNKTADYIVAKASNSTSQTLLKTVLGTERKIYFDLPFSRFYMEESKAKPAENIVRRQLRDSTIKNVYGLVYIKEGNAVLENVFIDDVPIAEYVTQHSEE